MQVRIITAQHSGTCARPASGSAFLSGQVVTVTVPALTISDGLLAIGDEWMELHVTTEGDQAVASSNRSANVVS